jgi:hypothetical protein
VRREDLQKNPPVPHAVRALYSYSAISYGQRKGLLAIWEQIANGARNSVSGLLFTTYSCLQWRYELIKPKMLFFSVASQQRNECSATLGTA